MDVIEWQQVGVRYREARSRSLKQAAIHGLTRRSEGGWFHSLRGVSLRIRQGEAVGVVGSNGAGKSTLLRVAAGIIPPSQGTVISRGRVAPLIELGTGFEPEFSGRENILFNGALLGCSRRHMLARMQGIIDFSGLEAFIEQPLRTYSTGMVARLALAVAAATDAETLLLDEVLAVGDSGFRRQCAERLHAFVREGVTVVLVSHELEVIEALCSRVLWLQAGELVADGPAAEVLQRYREASAVPD